MPRARKTMTGAKAQPVSSIPGQMYGVGVEQQRLQQAMPTPQVQATKPAIPTGQPASPPAQTSAPAPTADMGMLAQAMRDKVGLLRDPSQRPNEPVTTGLTRGAGAGPEALSGVRQSPLGDTLRELSMVLGDPYFAQLAQKARL